MEAAGEQLEGRLVGPARPVHGRSHGQLIEIGAQAVFALGCRVEHTHRDLLGAGS